MTNRQSQNHLHLYAKYLVARDSLPINGRFMPYSWSELPDSLSAAWLPYSGMMDEFARELSNTINDLTNHVHRLEAWTAVFTDLSDDDKMEAVHEFVGVLGIAALGLPYVIKSRFAYAAAHLCHQANLAKDGASWVDEFPEESAIYLNQAEPFGNRWKAFGAFKRRVEKIGGASFKKATGDFRNAYNHRFPRRLVLGLSGLVTRQIDPATGRPFYGIGGVAALSLDEVIKFLSIERDHSYAAFEAFQNLVREHEAAIKQGDCFSG